MINQNITLPSFENTHVLVYGDLMLDRYFHGDTTRISPEAPVPIVNITSVESRPGGAANVAQNIAKLGATVSLFGWVGQDTEATELQNSLHAERVTCRFLPITDFDTITKVRVLGRQQQLLRMDFENTTPATPIDDDALYADFCVQLKTAQVVVLSDYSKGALHQVERLIAAANQAGVPILIDPKHKNYQRYAGATMITPNRKEFEAVVGPCVDIDDIAKKARELLSEIAIESLLVTLGKQGMVLIRRNEEAVHFSSKAQDVFDVTGAGDTVIGVLAAGFGAGMKTVEAVELANCAAGIVVGRLGAESVSLSELQQGLLQAGDTAAALLTESQLLTVVKDVKGRSETIVMTNGCFDVLHPGHVDYLAQAKALGDRLIVAVNSDESVRSLKGDARPYNSLAARMRVLSALHCVDWVVPFYESTPARLIEAVMPDILVKGNDYQPHEIAGHDVVTKNGGRVLTVPLLDGFSTTRLIKKIREAGI